MKILHSSCPWAEESTINKRQLTLSFGKTLRQGHLRSLSGTVKTTEKQDTIRFRLKVGSYNTMTLHSRGEDGEILSESTRAAMLRQQLADAGYHVVGLQETRCNQQTVFSSDNFHRYTSGEDKERPGFWGCELWFRRGVIIAKSRSASFQFEAKNITILHSHPRLLLAHIKLGGHSIVFASGHAPHEGASDDEKDDWWNMLNSACSNYGHLGRWVSLWRLQLTFWMWWRRRNWRFGL